MVVAGVDLRQARVIPSEDDLDEVIGVEHADGNAEARDAEGHAFLLAHAQRPGADVGGVQMLTSNPVHSRQKIEQSNIGGNPPAGRPVPKMIFCVVPGSPQVPPTPGPRPRRRR